MVRRPTLRPSITVVGSSNVDLIAEVYNAPDAGETVIGRRFGVMPGGKGHNQAIATARMGAAVDLVSRVGADDYAQVIFDSLDLNSISHSHVSTDRENGTGTALITIDAAGQNRIVATPRANATLSATQLDRAATQIGSAGALLMSCEVPMSALLAAASLAGRDTWVCLNASPVQSIPQDLFSRTHVLIVNEIEASSLASVVIDSITSAQQAAQILRTRIRSAVVVTLGEQGSVLVADGPPVHQPAFGADVRDTTGAGDAFCGALAFGLAAGLPLNDAVILGSAAGALVVTAVGATAGMAGADAVYDLASS